MKKLSLVLIVIVTLFSACAAQKTVSGSVGVFDLSSGLEKGTIARLDGQWDFFWNVLLEPGQSIGAAGEKSTVTVPAAWNGTMVKGSPISGHGVATYHAVIRLPYEEGLFSLKFLDAATSYRAYVNGKLVAENGKVSADKNEYIAGYRPQTAAFTLEKPLEGNISTVDIMMQVANFAHKKGGLWETIRFGRQQDITLYREKRIALEIFLFGFISIMVIYHFGLFLLRRQDRSALYFGLFALVLALRTILTGERGVTLLFPDMNWFVMLRLEYLSSYVNMLFVVLFVYALFGEHLSAIVKKIFVVWGVIISAVILCMPLAVIFTVKPIFDIYLLATGFFITPALLYLTFRRVRGAGLACIGMAAMFFTGLNDILYGNLVINTFNMSPIGLAVFILAQSYLLSSLSAHSYRRAQAESDLNRAQSEENKKQNEFIRRILSTASGSILASSQKMALTIDSFRVNAHGQASSIEEVAASIEEISAAAQSIAMGTDNQEKSLASLGNALTQLAHILSQTEQSAGKAMNTAGDISDNARAGSQSIAVMKGSMDEISASSAQMNGIIQIINDISDRINLLSLNAAIEAARAGDAGRGFAVVADEISKLADATASSIKEIDSLIRRNEDEIRKGTANIVQAVGSVTRIIDNVGSVNSAIAEVSRHIGTQLTLNSGVNSEAETVRMRSGEIRDAMGGQKKAVDEISQTISSINELAQDSSLGIEDLSECAGNLTLMIHRMTEEIEEYGREGNTK